MFRPQLQSKVILLQSEIIMPVEYLTTKSHKSAIFVDEIILTQCITRHFKRVRTTPGASPSPPLEA